MSRLSSDHVVYEHINNPTIKEQHSFIKKHLGYIPDDYEEVKYNHNGKIHVFINTKLNECWIGTYWEGHGKTKCCYQKTKVYRKDDVNV